LNLNDAIIRLRDSGTRPRRVRRPGKPLVLVVDDIVEQRDLYEYFLASYFELVSAARGPEAIAIAVARQPDAIVLDVEMPEMNGMEVCRRLKRHKDTAAIPVLMLTGTPDDVHVDAREAGAAAVLKKPCSVDALLEQILGSIITAQALAQAEDDSV
jgi:two-component system cell cycle response regulator